MEKEMENDMETLHFFSGKASGAISCSCSKQLWPHCTSLLTAMLAAIRL